MSTSTPELLRVAIVGGGLAGLTTAYELIRLTRIDALPLEIRLYEASTRVGGVIRSERTEGFLVERGPDSFSTDKGLITLVYSNTSSGTFCRSKFPIYAPESG